MANKSWNIGKITVGGSAMLGDHNQMEVHEDRRSITLTPEVRERAHVLATELKDNVELGREGFTPTGASAEREAVLRALQDVLAALEKKDQPVPASLFKRSLDTINKVLEHAPAALAVVGKLTALIGL